MIEIFPELAHATDFHIMLPSKKALRRFPCATVLPRPIPASLNAQSLLSDCIRRNVVEIADLAMRRIPKQVIELDRILKAKLINRKTDETKWQSRTLTSYMQRRPNINESEARGAIIQHALHIQNLRSSSIAARSVQLGCLSRTSLKESSTAGATPTLNNAKENDSNNPFDVASSSRNHIPDSLVIPTNRSVNSTANVLQISQTQTTKARFSIKVNWSRK